MTHNSQPELILYKSGLVEHEAVLLAGNLKNQGLHPKVVKDTIQPAWLAKLPASPLNNFGIYLPEDELEKASE